MGRVAAVDAEQLGFDERIREVPAVDHHEGMGRPFGQVVDRACRELATAPGLSDEQDGSLARRQAPELGKEAPEDGILTGRVLEPGSDIAALRVLRMHLVLHGLRS